MRFLGSINNTDIVAVVFLVLIFIGYARLFYLSKNRDKKDDDE